MINNKLCRAVLCFCFIALVGGVSFAQDWHGWRGPNRDGTVLSFSAPKVWPDQLKVKSKIPVGLGHSSPVVAGRAVYVFSRQDEQEVVSAIDLDSGKLLWKDGYATPYTMNPAAVSHG